VPDYKVSIEDVVAAEDRVVLCYSELGTHVGDSFSGLPSTGDRLITEGISMYRVKKGKLAEEWFFVGVHSSAASKSIWQRCIDLVSEVS